MLKKPSELPTNKNPLFFLNLESDLFEILEQCTYFVHTKLVLSVTLGFYLPAAYDPTHFFDSQTLLFLLQNTADK